MTATGRPPTGRMPSPPGLRRPGSRLGTLLVLCFLAGCAAPPPLPPKHILEYERQSSAGHEKYAQGYIDQARSSFQRALTHAELDDSGERIASALINLGGTELLLDDAESAGRLYARALRAARGVGAGTLEWQAQNGLAEASRRLGQPDKALDLYAFRTNPAWTASNGLILAADIGRASALADVGRVDEALAMLAGVDAAAAKGLPETGGAEAAALHARARILFKGGRNEEALAYARRALDKDRLLHHPPSVAEDHRLIAEILATAGRDAEAGEHRDRAAAIFSHTGQARRLSTPRHPERTRL